MRLILESSLFFIWNVEKMKSINLRICNPANLCFCGPGPACRKTLIKMNLRETYQSPVKQVESKRMECQTTFGFGFGFQYSRFNQISYVDKNETLPHLNTQIFLKRIIYDHEVVKNNFLFCIIIHFCEICGNVSQRLFLFVFRSNVSDG